jgi:hypothetical protein
MPEFGRTAQHVRIRRHHLRRGLLPRAGQSRMAFARAALLAAAAVVVVASAAIAFVSSTYDFSGVEIAATSTRGTFAGAATGSGGDAALWQAAIDHSVDVDPKGIITGGYADLWTSDGTTVSGDLAYGGTIRKTSSGHGRCGNQVFAVEADLVNVTRTDTGATGTGSLSGTLVHYRTWFLGDCLTYSASVSGTIALHF